MPKRKKKLSEAFPKAKSAGATTLDQATYPEERKVSEVIQGTKGIEYSMPQHAPTKSKSLNNYRLKIKGQKYLL
jgi:hypothetical protein